MTQEYRITVTDPVKNTDKFGNFISYRVGSQIDRIGFDSSSKCVERRYSDFVWLSHELSKSYPGSILPPLPDKQTMGRFSVEFIESRRRGLERFLIRLAAHNELGVSQELIAFLQADDTTFQKVKEESSKNNKPKLSSTLAWLEGTVNTITVGMPEMEKTAADMKIDEINLYISELEKHLSTATRSAEQLVKRNKEISQSYFDLAEHISKLGQSEGDSIGAGFASFGVTIGHLSSVTDQHADSEYRSFLEPLEDYLRMISSIKSAVQQRNDKKIAYINCLADVEVKTQAHRKLVGVAGKENQARSKEEAVISAQESADQAKLSFEKITEKLLNEFEDFKKQKANDFKQCLIDFVNLQIEYNQKCEDAWNELIPRLTSMTLPYQAHNRSDNSIGFFSFSDKPLSMKKSFVPVAQEGGSN